MTNQTSNLPRTSSFVKRWKIVIILVCIQLVLVLSYSVLNNINNKKIQNMYLGAVEYIEENPFSEELYGSAFEVGYPEEAGRTEKKTRVDNGIYRLPIVVIIPDKDASYLVWVECKQSKSGNEYSYANIIEIDAEWSK